MKRFISIASGSLILAMLAWSLASAQTPTGQPSGQALEIAPPVLNVRGNPGETVKAQISLRDISPVKLLVKNEINDFTANNEEDGTPKILLEEGEVSPYSIKSWISPLPQITLNPKEVQQLNVNISIPHNAAPGGYYGVIRFTAEAPGLSQSGVSLSASLGALVLLRVNGDAKEAMNIEEFFTAVNNTKGSLFESTPIQFYVRIKNSGNIHEQPRGQIAIKDMFGQNVANLNVNLENRNVLPGSIRKFVTSLDQTVIGNKILFGRYTADLIMTYGNNQQTASSLSFWVIPYKLIAMVIGGLLLLFIVLRIGIRRYNEHIIGQTRGRRRRR